MNCTLLKSNTAKSGSTEPLLDILNKIKDGYWRELVANIRTGRAQKDKAMAFMPCGVFEQRTQLKEFSGVMQLDIDHKHNATLSELCDDFPKEVIAMLKNDPHTFAAFRSLSGKGVCVLIKVPTPNINGYFQALKRHYRYTYDIVIDAAVGSLNELRFISHDFGLYLNTESKVWTREEEAPTIAPPKPEDKPKLQFVSTPNRDYDLLQRIASAAEDNGLSLLEEYEEWYMSGLAIANFELESGIDCYSIFDRLSSLSGKYDINKNHKQYQISLKRIQTKPIGIAFIIKLAKNHKLI